MKYRPNKELSALMSGWLTELYLREAWDATLVVPVPLSEARLLQRGFNQVALISAPLAHNLDLQHDEKALSRDRDTRSQVGLDATARLRNVQGAFRGQKESLHGQRVLVVDDLYTTGATMSACAEALLDAEAEAVYGLTVGRARGKL
jgi:ComF family protein